MARPDDGDHVDTLLVGGGVAAAAAAEELRAQGFTGSIAVASRENEAPYYRFYLTKEYLRGRMLRDDLAVHSPEWWTDNEVDLWLRAPVMDLDTQDQTAKVGRRTVHWGKVLLATGANVRTISCPGAALDGVHYLRTTWTADALREDLETARTAVVVGGSFIAAETAASLAATGVHTTMVFPESLPLAGPLGPPLGLIVEAELTRLGVALRPGTSVEAILGEARAHAVLLSTAEELPADVVVVGIGARPEATLARRAGLTLGATGGVLCDRTLRAEHPSVWAAGDVCEFDSVRHGRHVRIEHDRVAAAQGRHAARSMLGEPHPFDTYPYFWTSIGEDLRIDVLRLEAAGTRIAPVDFEDHPDLRGAGAGRHPAFHYGAEGRATGFASVNGSLDLRVARRQAALASQDATAGAAD